MQDFAILGITRQTRFCNNAGVARSYEASEVRTTEEEQVVRPRVQLLGSVQAGAFHLDFCDSWLV